MRIVYIMRSADGAAALITRDPTRAITVTDLSVYSFACTASAFEGNYIDIVFVFGCVALSGTEDYKHVMETLGRVARFDASNLDGN